MSAGGLRREAAARRRLRLLRWCTMGVVARRTRFGPACSVVMAAGAALLGIQDAVSLCTLFFLS